MPLLAVTGEIIEAFDNQGLSGDVCEQRAVNPETNSPRLSPWLSGGT
jgi:hypothetical protein